MPDYELSLTGNTFQYIVTTIMSSPFPHESGEGLPDFLLSEEQRNKLKAMLAQVADAAVDTAYSMYIEGTDTHDVASELLSNAGILIAVLDTDRATELIRTFEAMNLVENKETAPLYAKYRTIKIDMLLLHTDTSDPSIRELVAEQIESPHQDERSSIGMYERLALSGDSSAFEKWLSASVQIMMEDPEIMSEHEPFPAFAGWNTLCTVTEQLSTKASYAATESVRSNEEAQTKLLDYLDAIAGVFDRNPRKALLAVRISRPVKAVADAGLQPAAGIAEALYIRMLRVGVEDAEDRIGERITDSRLHKNLIISLVAAATDKESTRTTIDKQLESWQKQGMFDERDLSKIDTWRNTHTQRAVTGRKSRKKKR